VIAFALLSTAGWVIAGVVVAVVIALSVDEIRWLRRDNEYRRSRCAVGSERNSGAIDLRSPF